MVVVRLLNLKFVRMFKINVKKKVGKYDIPGSYVGVLMGHSATSNIAEWKILSYDTRREVYYRSRMNYEDHTMSQPHKDHIYTHKEIANNLEKKFWVIKSHNDG